MFPRVSHTLDIFKMAAEGGKIFNSKYRSVLERYYKKFYKTNINGVPFADQCVLQHSNKICIVTVAPRHPLLSMGEVVKVNFQVSKNVNRLDNKVSGKGKKGAQHLSPTSPLCDVTCSTGEKYTLYSCIKGKLVEVNQSLEKNPGLLNKKPMTEGYIAVVLARLHEVDETLSKLMTQEDYDVLQKQREISEPALAVGGKHEVLDETQGIVSDSDCTKANIEPGS